MADYVIVGAGAGGCVLANELSKTGATVVLLEAGRRDINPAAKVPAAFSKLFKTKHDWNYWTAPQEELYNRELYWPRGKILGGSTSMNAMIYQRGHRHTFDAWAESGNDGWSYGDLLPAFMALEDQQRGPSDFHGVGGGLTVSDLRTVNPLSQAFVDAAGSMGLPLNDDFNDDTQEGFGLYQVTQRDGVRCSAATAFLKPAMKRDNLTVHTGAQVTRVVFRGGRAVGVDWSDGKGTHRTTASTEVILCGGAINSPQLLMLSGIGPAEHLLALGIDVQHDSSNVGQNLIDHVACGVIFEVTDPISLAHAEALGPVIEYVTKRTGHLSSNVGEAGGFITLGEGPMPDMQYHVAPGVFLDHGFDRPEIDGITIGATLVDVKSRGEITLASADPFAHPIIDPRYLTDPADMWLLVEGCKLAREFAADPMLSKFIEGEFLPGPVAQDDHSWESHVRARTESLYHPVGTCAMGPSDEDVCDPTLSVNGVDGLRVADASVMPTIAVSYTHLTLPTTPYV